PRPTGPPPPPARRPPPLESTVPHRPVGLNRLLHAPEHLAVASEPAGPARVPGPVVEHRAPPPGEVGGRHEARRERPVLEQKPLAIDLSVAPRPNVWTQSTPSSQEVYAGENAVQVEL